MVFLAVQAFKERSVRNVQAVQANRMVFRDILVTLIGFLVLEWLERRVAEQKKFHSLPELSGEIRRSTVEKLVRQTLV